MKKTLNPEPKSTRLPGLPRSDPSKQDKNKTLPQERPVSPVHRRRADCGNWPTQAPKTDALDTQPVGPQAAVLADRNCEKVVEQARDIINLFLGEDRLWADSKLSRRPGEWRGHLGRPRVVLFGYNFLLFDKAVDGSICKAAPTRLDDQCLLLTLQVEHLLKDMRCAVMQVDMVSNLPGSGDRQMVSDINHFTLVNKDFPATGRELLESFGHSPDIEILTRREMGYGVSSDTVLSGADHDREAANLHDFQKGLRILWATENEYKNKARDYMRALIDPAKRAKKFPNGLPAGWSVVDATETVKTVYLRLDLPGPSAPLDIPIARQREDGKYNPLCPLVFFNVLTEMMDMEATHFIGIFRDDEVPTANRAIKVARDVFGVKIPAIIVGIDSDYNFTTKSINGDGALPLQLRTNPHNLTWTNLLASELDPDEVQQVQRTRAYLEKIGQIPKSKK